jgi:succinoglycan biosynthesis protein ExoM
MKRRMPTPHISVCICTYKRAVLLAELLAAVDCQQTGTRFTYDVVVADNDAAGSAREVCEAFAASSAIRLTYAVEPVPNIARARNLAVSHAHGDLLAFIDDDECPRTDWLLQLFETWRRTGQAAVLGPVVPAFDVRPPAWLTRGRFFDRPSYPTGTAIDWPSARSGNVLIVKAVAVQLQPPFRPDFAAAGEDVDFFRRLAQGGHHFVWCQEAAVFEHVPAARCTRRYLLRRAALRGSNFPKHPTHRLRNAIKSLVAVPCYTAALPLLAVAGHHHFLAYLIKLFDHGSRLLAFAGLPVVTERET